MQIRLSGILIRLTECLNCAPLNFNIQRNSGINSDFYIEIQSATLDDQNKL